MGPTAIRAATPEDAPAAIAVLRASIVELCLRDHRNDAASLEAWLGNKTEAHFRRWQADPDNYLVVAGEDGSVQGVGLVHRSGEVRLCYVLPGSDGHGIGRTLLESLEAQARHWDLRELRLLSSLTARPFYERLGYRSAGKAVPGFGITRGYPYVKDLGQGGSCAKPR